MAFTGQNIADEARADLNDGDASNYRWSDADMLRYVNAAQRRIVSIVPEANIVIEDFVVSNADSRQDLPTGGIKFIGAWNYDAANSRRGPALTEVEFDAMNSAFPEWPFIAAHATHLSFPDMEDEHTDVAFEHFAHDPRDPTVFWIFPATETATFELSIQYAKLPTVLATLAGSFALGDHYYDAAVSYTKYRMHAKDGRYGAGDPKMVEVYNDFLRALGQKIQGFQRVDPATARPPADEHG